MDHPTIREPYGIGGWLAFFLFQIAAGIGIVTIGLAFMLWRPPPDLAPVAIALLLYRLIVGGFVLAFIIVPMAIVLYAAFYQRRWFPRALLLLAIWLVALNILDMVTTTTPGDRGRDVAGVIFCIIWGVYAVRSKRIKNTYHSPLAHEAVEQEVDHPT
jgi:Protein of unknown function (DUF2569)